MGGFYHPDANLGPIRVVAFSGRESDAPFGIWGAIAEQLGRRDQLADYYSPLAAPGQSAWVNLLQGEPLVIMLDELPPYLVNAASKTIGNSDLAAVTTTALSNLFVALGREELHNVCLVLSDLTASYGTGTASVASALQDLEAETGRSAMNLEPVRMNTGEIYDILRKRLFETLPEQADIEAVAEGYARAIREAKQMDVTNVSPEQFAARVVDSWPFHPAIRDLYARFRENQGFQQTRGLIRLMRIVVSRIWESPDRDPYLIATHDLDLGDRETLTELHQIIAEMHQEGVADGDVQMQQARDGLLPRFLARFHSAIRETFTTLHYPTRDRLAKADFLMEFRENRYDGEEQVRKALEARQKYTTDTAGEIFRRKVEARLLTQKSMLWSEIERRAATSPAWQWHRPDALTRLKADCVHRDLWREEGSYVDKGPFPKPANRVR